MADSKFKFELTQAPSPPSDAIAAGWCSAYEGFRCLVGCVGFVCLRWPTRRSELDRYHDAVGALLTAVYDNDTNATIEAVELVELLRDGFGIGPAPDSSKGEDPVECFRAAVLVEFDRDLQRAQSHGYNNSMLLTLRERIDLLGK